MYHDLSIGKEKFGVLPKFGYRLFMVQWGNGDKVTYRKCPDPKGNRCFSYDNYVDTSIGNFDDETSEVFCYKRKEYDVVFLDGEVRDEFLYRMRKVMKKNTVIIVHDINTYRDPQKVELLMNANEYKVLLEVTNSSSPFGFAIVGRR